MNFDDTYAQATLFLGLGTMSSMTAYTDKIGFYFGYAGEYNINNTLEYRQYNPYLYLNKTQQSNARMRYAGRIAFYARRSCPTDTIYLYL